MDDAEAIYNLASALSQRYLEYGATHRPAPDDSTTCNTFGNAYGSQTSCW
jgi:hypothetical protein